MSEQLSLSMGFDANELAGVQNAIEEFAQGQNWEPDVVFHISLVVEEIVLNVVNHGSDGDEGKIRIEISSNAESVRLDIIDDGRPFNPLVDAPVPDVESSIEERAVGGLGIHLIRTMVDEISYLLDDEKNHLTIVQAEGRVNLRLRWVFSLMAGAALLWQAPGAAAATPGVSGERVLFGQSAAFSGPAQALGKNMLLGIQAAFEAANARGGVHGRKLDLVSFDDAYEPEAAIANTRNLIENEKVFALIGAVGTPTSLAAVPVAAEAEVPYIAPFTGASFLRDPKWKNVINMRASYFQETEEMVNRLIQDRGIRRIAVLYQDDSFGRAGWQGVLRALKRRKLEPTGTGVYPRNTRVVKTALLDIRRARPEAVIIIGAYAPVSFFHQLGAPDRLQPRLRQHFLRRQQRARPCTRHLRPRRLRYPGGAVPDVGRLRDHGGLPPGPRGV